MKTIYTIEIKVKSVNAFLVLIKNKYPEYNFGCVVSEGFETVVITSPSKIERSFSLLSDFKKTHEVIEAEYYSKTNYSLGKRKVGRVSPERRNKSNRGKIPMANTSFKAPSCPADER